MLQGVLRVRVMRKGVVVIHFWARLVVLEWAKLVLVLVVF